MTSRTNPPTNRVSLSTDARAAILARARDGASDSVPREVCGVLAGHRADGSRAGRPSDADSGTETDIVERAVPIPNVADDPRTEYELDPATTVETIDALEAEGLDLVGFYHSHPESHPTPSPTDEARAGWPGYVYLLCHPDGRLNAYRWTGEAFEELRVVASE
ncbi:desampylase [Halogeometricum luteum]|uniref:M67 family metallopeptidase n=1 Tax=Halogeometricum luteum TaxID=2950537 RepID=A0ABU2G116_9EURY|nr:desampylase [Halogeometricum sp. S3BR5-2]MDS0294483.1 M67 family metallopeptidase [Halogeometricum sp. S3BR5-2]